MFIDPRAGDIAEYKAQMCEVLSYEDDVLTLRGIDADHELTLSTTEYERAAKRGEFALTDENAYRGVSARTAFCLLPADKKAEAMARRDLLLMFEGSSENGSISNGKVRKLTRSWSKRLGRERPDHSTVRRWLSGWKASGRDLFSLVPQTHARGNRKSRFPTEVELLLGETINKKYLTRQRNTIAKSYRFLEDSVRVANKGRPAAFQLPCPSKKAFKRRISAIDPFHIDLKRLGREEAERRHKAVKRYTRTACWPNHIWQVDATPLDILPVDPENGEAIRRVYLTVVIDQFSRCIVGYYLSPDKPSYVSIAKAILHGITPKDDIAERFPGIRGLWRCYGRPAILICDNGRENHSIAFSEMCASPTLGIDLVYTPRKYPQGKPHVERVIGTINKFFHGLPGTTFSNPKERGDYPSKKLACHTIEDIEEQLLRFIIDIYHVRDHSELGRSPEEVWQEGVVDFPPRRPPHTLDLEWVYMVEDNRVLHKDGIHFSNHIYQGPVTEELWSRHGKMSVNFRYDPDKRASILVVDPDTGDAREARCCNMPEYASKVSSKQDREVRRIAATIEGDLTKEQRVARAYVESDAFANKCKKRNDTRRRSANCQKKASATKDVNLTNPGSVCIDPSDQPNAPLAPTGPNPSDLYRWDEGDDEDWGGGTDLLSIKKG